MHSLTRVEAAERAALLTVASYAIDLDLTRGEHAFRSTTIIRFQAARPGADTFVEIRPVRLIGATLNGTALDPAALDGNRLPLTGLAADNELTVEAEMAYTNTGEGLHRFVDPADGAVYLFAMSFLDRAQRIFACFDQPDLKAPVTVTATAPPDWLVAANGAPAEVDSVDGGRHAFVETRPLATYFVSLIAGPYHVRRDEHDGVPLGLYCRRSQAPHLDADADEIFTITKQCLDRFHELFGVRYPFGKYDQAFVPELNEGAMENPGLVTFRDDYIFRSVVTDTEREQRAVTIAHEMAHMWFGDLVTMRWWDDLWLNESFAEYLGVRVASEATRFRQTWTTFAMRRKAWGYAADQRPSTHPVAPTEVADTALAVLNFDGISYAKGASALRQLVALLGDEAFLAGMRAHFAAHRFGNATLADLLGALSAASGRDLDHWAEVWLRRAQVNTLRASTATRDGRYTDVHIEQSAPDTHPTLRPHRIGVGVYDGPVRRSLLSLEVDGGQTPVPALTGGPVADLLLVNDGDLTFAKVRLDEASAAAVPKILATLADPLARAVVWSSIVDAVRDADRPPADLVALMLAALPTETEVIIVEDLLTMGTDLLARYLDGAARDEAFRHVAQACDRLLAAAPPGSSRQLAAARGLVRVTTDASRLSGWLDGVGVPAGLTVDADLRWRVRYRLAVLGAVGLDAIEVELAGDRSANGAEWAARCRAALPEQAAKERAWQAVMADTGLSGRLVTATAEGFWHPEQAALTEAYVGRYFDEIVTATRRRTRWVAQKIAELAFPRFAVAQATRDAAAALLARDDLVSALRRKVVDADDDLRRALVAREPI